MITELNHVGIFTADLNATEKFYTELFGARVAWRGFIESFEMDILYLQISGGLVEFLSFRDPEKNSQRGTDHLGFISDDLDADYASLVEAGYRSAVAPKVSGSGIGRQAFVLDSNDVRIELIERDLPLRPSVVEHSVVKALDHLSLRTDDLSKSLDLFRDRMGIPVLRELKTSSGATITYLQLGDDTLEFLTGFDAAARLHHIALRVDDVDEALAFFVDSGYQPDGASRPAGTGVGRIGSITDPNGVMIEILDRPPLADLP